MLIEAKVQGALGKELLIASSVEHLEAATLGESLLRDFVSTWNNLLKYCTSVNILLKECYAQVALRKKLFIALFAECFKTTTLEKSQ